MSRHIKAARLLAVTAAAAAITALSGCSTIREYYEYYLGGIDENAREPTGFEDVAEAKPEPDRLKVPAGLETPPKDPTMVTPLITPDAARYPVGDDLDIRAPVAPLRSDLGVHSQWSHGEAFVWFERGREHGVETEDDAWRLLGRVLKRMNIGVGKASPDSYTLTTAIAQYNEFGSRYNAADMGEGIIRYNQVYRIRVGRSQNGDLGIATALIGSMTLLPISGKNIEDELNLIEQERFAMGFSNSFIHELDRAAAEQEQGQSGFAVTLGRDHNGRECIVADARYDDTWKALRGMLPKFNWNVTEYSLSKGSIKFEADDQDAEVFHSQGVDSFALEEDDYMLRLGEENGKSVITFYDGDEKALPAATVDRIYSGFSQALSRELTELGAAIAAPEQN